MKISRREFLTLTATGLSISISQWPQKPHHSVKHKQIMILMPFTSAKRYPLVIYHHGSGETAQSLKTDGLKQGVINALRQNGYIVVAHDAQGNNWGNPAAVNDYAAVMNYCLNHYPIYKIVFLSQSMGGLTGLTCMADPRFSLVSGWYGIYPSCNLRNMYDLHFAAAINQAYGIAIDGSDYAERTEGSDPVLRDYGEFLPVRYRFTASYDDSVVPRSSNADIMAGLIAGEVPEADIVPAMGEHGHESHFIPQDVVDFFNRC